ncbi:MAG TPA: nucleotide disphospho-sugar-binding domain-containing protein [Thermoanaerobaculia bacterium]|jgi:MGT family glycosyltransferase
MGKGVFLNVSGGGHVIATYGLVAELVRRGEKLLYFEAPPFQQDIEALGAEFRSYPPIRPYTGPLAGSRFHHELDLAPILTWCALEWIPQIIDQVREFEPDYIVHDSLCIWGRVIAHVLQIPAICSVHTPAFRWRLALASGKFWRDMPEMFLRSRKSLQYFRTLERQLRATYDLPRMGYMQTFTNPQPVNICHTPRELQPHDHLLDDTYHFIASVHTRPNSEKPAFPMERLRDKLIYIGFGTICDPGPQFYRNCLEAFRDLDYQVLLTLSASTKPADLGPVPDNFLVWSVAEQGLAPQLDILPRTSLFVMNGGMGGSREAAWNAVPMLAFGTTFETYSIAERIEEQGAGLALPPDAAPARIREAALRVLSDPSFKANSARIGDACRAAGGAERGADLILNHAHRHTARVHRAPETVLTTP